MKNKFVKIATALGLAGIFAFTSTVPAQAATFDFKTWCNWPLTASAYGYTPTYGVIYAYSPGGAYLGGAGWKSGWIKFDSRWEDVRFKTTNTFTSLRTW